MLGGLQIGSKPGLLAFAMYWTIQSIPRLGLLGLKIKTNMDQTLVSDSLEGIVNPGVFSML